MDITVPTNRVYVEFEDGRRDCVYNVDTLYPCEALAIKNDVERNGKGVKITLETSSGQLLEQYDY